MKFLSTLSVALFALAQTSAQGQTKPAAASRSTAPTARTGATSSCVAVGTLSPKIPALPSGTPCPKALYTLTVTPSAKLTYVSPLEDAAALRETFGTDITNITLAYVDIKVGTGAVVTQDKFLSLLYTGYLSDGTEFDSSAKHGGDPLVIPYGKRAVIMGWDTGLDGMRVGGKRRLFIPFQLAYGPQGHPPAIPAKAELIFDVEFVAQSDTPPAPKAPPASAPQPPPSTMTPPAATTSPAAPHSSTPPATPPAATQPAPQAAPTTTKPQ